MRAEGRAHHGRCQMKVPFRVVLSMHMCTAHISCLVQTVELHVAQGIYDPYAVEGEISVYVLKP